MNVKPEIIKLLGENIDSKLLDTTPGDISNKIWLQRQWKQKQKWINGTTSNWKASAQQKKPSTE